MFNAKKFMLVVMIVFTCSCVSTNKSTSVVKDNKVGEVRKSSESYEVVEIEEVGLGRFRMFIQDICIIKKNDKDEKVKCGSPRPAKDHIAYLDLIDPKTGEAIENNKMSFLVSDEGLISFSNTPSLGLNESFLTDFILSGALGYFRVYSIKNNPKAIQTKELSVTVIDYRDNINEECDNVSLSLKTYEGELSNPILSDWTTRENLKKYCKNNSYITKSILVWDGLNNQDVARKKKLAKEKKERLLKDLVKDNPVYIYSVGFDVECRRTYNNYFYIDDEFHYNGFSKWGSDSNWKKINNNRFKKTESNSYIEKKFKKTRSFQCRKTSNIRGMLLVSPKNPLFLSPNKKGQYYCDDYWGVAVAENKKDIEVLSSKVDDCFNKRSLEQRRKNIDSAPCVTKCESERDKGLGLCEIKRNDNSYKQSSSYKRCREKIFQSYNACKRLC